MNQAGYLHRRHVLYQIKRPRILRPIVHPNPSRIKPNFMPCPPAALMAPSMACRFCVTRGGFTGHFGPWDCAHAWRAPTHLSYARLMEGPIQEVAHPRFVFRPTSRRHTAKSNASSWDPRLETRRAVGGSTRRSPLAS